MSRSRVRVPFPAPTAADLRASASRFHSPPLAPLLGLRAISRRVFVRRWRGAIPDLPRQPGRRGRRTPSSTAWSVAIPTSSSSSATGRSRPTKRCWSRRSRRAASTGTSSWRTSGPSVSTNADSSRATSRRRPTSPTAPSACLSRTAIRESPTGSTRVPIATASWACAGSEPTRSPPRQRRSWRVPQRPRRDCPRRLRLIWRRACLPGDSGTRTVDHTARAVSPSGARSSPATSTCFSPARSLVCSGTGSSSRSPARTGRCTSPTPSARGR